MKPTHPDDYSCRFNLPGAKMKKTPLYDQGFERFSIEDAEAAEHFLALLLKAFRNGIPFRANAQKFQVGSRALTYKSPVGKQALTRLGRAYSPTPWCGELRVDGSETKKGKQTFWRIYFSDLRELNSPNREIDEVLLSSIGKKTTTSKAGSKRGSLRAVAKKIRDSQDRDIDKAISAGINWCKKSKVWQPRELGRVVDRST